MDVALSPAQKKALQTLRAIKTGRAGDDLREHPSGMTLVYTTSYRGTVQNIENAVSALGGVVYSKRSALKTMLGGQRRRHTTIEWTVSPSADAYVLDGPKAMGGIRAVTL